MKKRLDSAEMWLSRRMCKILWKDKVAKEVVLKMADIKKELHRAIPRIQDLFFGPEMKEKDLDNLNLI